MKTGKPIIVPEPRVLEFTGEWFSFDGFKNLPDFLAQEFDVKKGSWEIRKVDGRGTGLRISEGVVEIWGDEKICYATLLQLVIQGKGFLPEAKIREEFRFRFRGYHLDIARGGVPTVKTFKRILRWLFLLKYNYFAIYFEDLFPWRRYPQIGRDRGRLTEEELREIVDYGSKLGIEVFPSLELAGHMENILRLPDFRKYSEWHRPSEGCLNLSDREAREFAYNLLEEVLEFFPSKHVHIGGDETWALGRGRSLNKTWRFEGPSLYLEHHSRMVKMVEKHGKTPLLWGDMLTGMYLGDKAEREKWSELLSSDIWSRAVIANWDYGARPEDYFREKIRLFSSRGYRQIVCPGFSNWNRYYPDFDVALENLRNFLGAARKEDVLGFMVTAWGDDGEECLFSFLDPLLLAAMEYAEGVGSWEDKWLALTGEHSEVLKARLLFGKREVSENIKKALFSPGKWLTSEEVLGVWRSVLREIEGVNLPEDLEFIRRCLITGLRKAEGKASVSEMLGLSAAYSRLWLGERKREGLERIVGRFWAAGGVIDLFTFWVKQ